MPLALLALAVSAFGIGTTEFVMMGLLPDVAASRSAAPRSTPLRKGLSSCPWLCSPSR
ncbi:hypothetical protein OG693_10245 [Streptomyces sp. NBC_01259]|uniref:hypothetical protein n=1 Tax=Streptomyces sp. NBC_01259 TaxID=2903800 RepID=UPI00325500BA